MEVPELAVWEQKRGQILIFESSMLMQPITACSHHYHFKISLTTKEVKGEGFVQNPSYSSLCQVQLASKYSSLKRSRKVKNMHQNLHHSEGLNAGSSRWRGASEGSLWEESNS